MASLLDQLKRMTVVVADTGEINAIKQYAPRDTTTNPTLIARAAQMEEYSPLIDNALRWSKNRGGNDDEIVRRATDRLSVRFGMEILGLIEGRVSTEVDARLSYDTDATIEKARTLIAMYREEGIDPKRVLIKIASTWEGIRAADMLEREGIRCNLTLMFGLHQAVACAEAAVSLISPFVGRILDWHQANGGQSKYAPAEDPGVKSVKEIYTYYKSFRYGTEIMGASFRNLHQILELAGCDLLTIAPKFLDELARTEGELEQKLDALVYGEMQVPRLEMKKPLFDEMHEKDRMAREKLDEGIVGFTQAIEELEVLLGQRLARL